MNTSIRKAILTPMIALGLLGAASVVSTDATHAAAPAAAHATVEINVPAAAAPSRVVNTGARLDVAHPHPEFAAGRTGDHAWLIVSAADVLAAGAGAACAAALASTGMGWAAGAVCFVVTGLLQQAANRWHYTSSHGVYITVGTSWYNWLRVSGGLY